METQIHLMADPRCTHAVSFRANKKIGVFCYYSRPSSLPPHCSRDRPSTAATKWSMTFDGARKGCEKTLSWGMERRKILSTEIGLMYYEVLVPLMCTEMTDLHSVYLEILFWMRAGIKKWSWEEEEKKGGAWSPFLWARHVRYEGRRCWESDTCAGKKRKGDGEQFMAVTWM